MSPGRDQKASSEEENNAGMISEPRTADIPVEQIMQAGDSAYQTACQEKMLKESAPMIRSLKKMAEVCAAKEFPFYTKEGDIRYDHGTFVYWHGKWEYRPFIGRSIKDECIPECESFAKIHAGECITMDANGLRYTFGPIGMMAEHTPVPSKEVCLPATECKMPDTLYGIPIVIKESAPMSSAPWGEFKVAHLGKYGKFVRDGQNWTYEPYPGSTLCRCDKECQLFININDHGGIGLVIMTFNGQKHVYGKQGGEAYEG